MSGNAKSKSSKNKPKNNNGQSAQNVNNGGPVVNSHANQSGCLDMNYMSSGQGPGQGMPQGPNMYPPPPIYGTVSKSAPEPSVLRKSTKYAECQVCKYAGSVSRPRWATNSTDWCSV